MLYYAKNKLKNNTKQVVNFKRNYKDYKIRFIILVINL